MLAQRGQVVWRAVSLIRCQSVHREDRVPGGDHAVPFDLGEDRGGGYRSGQRVTVDDRLLGKFTIEFYGIDEKMARRRRQLLDRMQHCEARSLINIDLIDAGGIDSGNGPGDGVLTNEGREFFATLGRKQFRIAQAANTVCGIENDGGGHNWAEQRSAADFIDSGNMPRARGPRSHLKFQSATQFFQKSQFGGRGRETVRFRTF